MTTLSGMLHMKGLSSAFRLFEIALILTLLSAMAFSSILWGSSNDTEEVRYYLTNRKDYSPFTRYLLKPDTPASTSPAKIVHPNNFLWCTDFQPEGQAFEAGWWSFSLWLEANESITYAVSFGYIEPFTYQYIPITDMVRFSLYEKPAKGDIETSPFTVPEGGFLAFRLNASSADLYVDSVETPSYIQFSTQPPSTTTTTITTSETQLQPTFIQTGTQTTETTLTSPSETQTSETTFTTFTTETSQIETQPYITLSSFTPGHFTLMVHAHLVEFQYPLEPSSELDVAVLVERYLNGVKRVEVKETPFIIEADGGSVANLTVISFEPGLTWVEWDNYGAGRTGDLRVSILMNSNRNAIAYLSPEKPPSTTTTEESSVIIVIPGYSNISILLGLLSAASLITVRRGKRQ
ncbi:MAG: hypothetical protein QW172_03830 [Candidatus Bathyarchaeia archaeon]